MSTIMTQINPYTTSHVANNIVPNAISSQTMAYHIISSHILSQLAILVRTLSCPTSTLLPFKNPYVSVYRSLHLPALDVC